MISITYKPSTKAYNIVLIRRLWCPCCNVRDVMSVQNSLSLCGQFLSNFIRTITGVDERLHYVSQADLIKPEDQRSCKRPPDYCPGKATTVRREKGAISILVAQEQLTLWSLIGSGQNSNSSKLLCMSSLPASMKMI